MKKKIGVIVFMLYAFVTICSCSKSNTSEAKKGDDSPKREVFKFDEETELQGTVIPIGKNYTCTFTKEIIDHMENGDFDDPSFLDKYPFSFIINIEKPGMLTIWTEGELDTTIMALAFRTDKKTGFADVSSIREFYTEDDIELGNYNSKTRGKVEPGKVFVILLLEDVSGITDAKLAAGIVECILKTEFRED